MTQFFRSFLPLLIAYGVSYAVWYAVMGAGFNNHNLLDFSHYLNPAWLKDDLIGSLLLLHSQPPLMNLLIGIIFKIAPLDYEIIFRVLYFSAGAVALWNIQQTLRVLSISRTVSIIVLSMLLVTPTFYMMGTWFATTHIEFFLTSMLVRYLTEYMVDKNYTRKALILLFISFALLGLLRPQWHLIIFIGLTFCMMLMAGRGERKKIALCALIFILPLGGWYAKNQFLFGFFGPSSWSGSNLALVAQQTAEDLKKQGVEVLVHSPDFPAQFDMRKVLARVPPQNYGNIPVTLQPYKSEDKEYNIYTTKVPGSEYIKYNLNYIGMIASAKRDGEDAKHIISEHPRAYVNRILANMVTFTRTPTYFHHSLNLLNAAHLVPESLQALSGIPAMGYYGILPVIILVFFIFRFRSTRYQLGFVLWIIAAYVLISSAAFNGYEGERIRWSIQPIYMIFAAIFLENCRKRWNNARHG